MKTPADLNDYHQQQSARLAKKTAEQPLLLLEASMKQIKRLSKQIKS